MGSLPGRNPTLDLKDCKILLKILIKSYRILTECI